MGSARQPSKAKRAAACLTGKTDRTHVWGANTEGLRPGTSIGSKAGAGGTDVCTYPTVTSTPGEASALDSLH